MFKKGRSPVVEVKKWVWLWVGLLTLVAFAGCLGGDAPPADEGGDGGDGDEGGDGGTPGDEGGETGEGPGNTTGPDVNTSTLVYEDCSIQGLQMWLPAEIFGGDLPEGFELASPDPAGQMGLLEVVGVDCPTVTLGSEEHTRVQEFRFHLDVVPPDEHENPDAVRHSLLLDSVLSDETVMGLYESWSLSAIPGNVSVSSTDAVAVRTGQMTVESPWETFDVHTAVQAADESCQDPVVFRTFGFMGDEVSGYVDMELDEFCYAMGGGSVVFEPFGTDPDGLALWLLITGATSGLAFHSMEDSFRVTQTHTSLMELVAVAVAPS